MLHVTCAIIKHKGKILICQRSERMDLPLKWEFSGGKVEAGEDERETIVREIKEELHLDIIAGQRMLPVEYNYPTFRICLIPFLAAVIGGMLKLEEHAQAKWVEPDDLDQYDWAPADITIIEQLKSLNV